MVAPAGLSHSSCQCLSLSPKAFVAVGTMRSVADSTNAHCSDYSILSPTTVPSMINNILPILQSSTQITYEPSDSRVLHSQLPRHRDISESRALATWLSLILLREKLGFKDPVTGFDEPAFNQQALTYRLTKSFQLLNPPTPAIFVALLYLHRCFPKSIPYVGNSDNERVIALQRIFLLCMRLALVWYEDQSLHFDFRRRRFKWHEHLDLDKIAFQNADVHILHLLDHNLCISNISYSRWLLHLLSTLPVYLGHHPEEYRAINDHIYAIRPSLTPEFLHPNCLPCTGLPLDKGWQPASSNVQEFEERGRNLIHCVTFGVATRPVSNDFIDIMPKPILIKNIAQGSSDNSSSNGCGPSRGTNTDFPVSLPAASASIIVRLSLQYGSSQGSDLSSIGMGEELIPVPYQRLNEEQDKVTKLTHRDNSKRLKTPTPSKIYLSQGNSPSHLVTARPNNQYYHPIPLSFLQAAFAEFRQNIVFAPLDEDLAPSLTGGGANFLPYQKGREDKSTSCRPSYLVARELARIGPVDPFEIKLEANARFRLVLYYLHSVRSLVKDGVIGERQGFSRSSSFTTAFGAVNTGELYAKPLLSSILLYFHEFDTYHCLFDHIERVSQIHFRYGVDAHNAAALSNLTSALSNFTNPTGGWWSWKP
ncbi:hypothetical protein BDP27DRAFT_1444389 [Rhodocollybia butyracea]|uniref:Uncharacterized protein n=1 Tax=Rhodocollybia butyracea TaxID=206335 RepID=A0A9P5Q4I4_9AGAR|nr:hypothetical protein BDP27DRAFT_1444389 [Rhodocollybia butyracea]